MSNTLRIGAKTVPLPLAHGQEIGLIGRVDRIDYHPQLDRWAVFDYKTSAKLRSPERSHQADGKWIDLQLPLYRHLVKDLGIESPLLGYIALPDDARRAGAIMANWSEDDLDAADSVARWVGEQVLNEVFWPPTEQQVGDEFARVVQEGVFRE